MTHLRGLLEDPQFIVWVHSRQVESLVKVTRRNPAQAAELSLVERDHLLLRTERLKRELHDTHCNIKMLSSDLTDNQQTHRQVGKYTDHLYDEIKWLQSLCEDKGIIIGLAPAPLHFVSLGIETAITEGRAAVMGPPRLSTHAPAASHDKGKARDLNHPSTPAEESDFPSGSSK
ncbi:MAG: hypothetical protein ACREHG_08795, partial [Candidatus Saccharimonadales bacterium]